MTTLESITISADFIAQMRTHVENQAPLEACGILGGNQGACLAVYPATNAAHSPVRYRIDAQEQVRIFNDLQAAGWDLLAMYHSHPEGPETPSQTDVAEAYYPEAAQLIWSRVEGRWQCRAFVIEDGNYREIELITPKDG